MEFDITEIVIILTYLSILTEILVFPVPSVASSFQLITCKRSLPDEFLYTKLQNLTLWQKIVLLVLPSLLSIVAYCIPLILVILSKFSNILIYKTVKIEFIIIAFLFILTGRVISLFSVLNIRKNNRQAGKSFELKTGKLFSFSRNPILFGMYLSYIGMIFLFPYYYMLIAFGFYVIHMHFRIRIEESFLKYKFGDKYIRYQEKTKRYI